MYANGANDEEFGALMSVAEARRLSPLHKQVYFVKRWDSLKRQEVWSVQTSIEGLRVIAERTGKYDGADLPEFEYRKDGSLLCCTVRVYRKDRTRAIVSKVFFDEAVQYTKDGNPTSFWKRMPHRMLAKCAESDALHRAFPEDMATGEDPYDADAEAETPPTAREVAAAVEVTHKPQPAPAKVASAPAPKPAAAPAPVAKLDPAPTPPPAPPPAPVDEPLPPEASVADAEFEEDPPHGSDDDLSSLILPFQTGKWVGKTVADLNSQAIAQAFFKGFRDVASQTNDETVREEKLMWAARVQKWAERNGWSVG